MKINNSIQLNKPEQLNTS